MTGIGLLFRNLGLAHTNMIRVLFLMCLILFFLSIHRTSRNTKEQEQSSDKWQYCRVVQTSSRGTVRAIKHDGVATILFPTRCPITSCVVYGF